MEPLAYSPSRWTDRILSRVREVETHQLRTILRPESGSRISSRFSPFWDVRANVSVRPTLRLRVLASPLNQSFKLRWRQALRLTSASRSSRAFRRSAAEATSSSESSRYRPPPR